MKTTLVYTHQSPSRLDAFIASDMPTITRTLVKELIKNGVVIVNDQVVCKPAFLLSESDVVYVTVPEAEVSTPTIEPYDLSLEVLYEDEQCYVINKPYGISVHPGHSSTPNEITILHGLAYMFKKTSLPFFASHTLVHRLDKNTTGCLLVAKNRQSHFNLQAQFQERSVLKEYLAIVHGIPNIPTAKIDAPIGRSVHDRTKMSVTNQTRSRSAQTSYTVVSHDEQSKASLLSCILHTGRTHQIRVHLASIAHPLISDTAYETKQYMGVFPVITHLNLHAYTLKFAPQSTEQSVHIIAPVPAKFQNSLHALAIPIPKNIILVDNL